MYEIINSVDKPSGSSYRVYEQGGAKVTPLYLNGKEELGIVPTVKDEVYRIFVTGKSM